ncbi:hypothetical protein [Hungatella hathewayi]|uniref:hypothetical protein n=1 Tax=Hungatella hathewayi TaxID=154046 RepID=UPI003568DCBD
MKENERDHFLEILCKEGTRIQLDKNQYFSSIINHENTAYCLISGVCALLRFTQNGEESYSSASSSGCCRLARRSCFPDLSCDFAGY